jgi:beta-glucosidase
LKGFERVYLAPGESRDVEFDLGPEHLWMLDAKVNRIVEPGRFRIQIGSSAEDIRLRGELVVQPMGSRSVAAGSAVFAVRRLALC